MSMMQPEMEPRERKEGEAASPVSRSDFSLPGLHIEAKNVPVIPVIPNIPFISSVQSAEPTQTLVAQPAVSSNVEETTLDNIQRLIQKGAARDDRLWSTTSIFVIVLAVTLVLLSPFLVYYTGNIIFGTASVTSGAFIAIISKLVIPSRTEAKERADTISDKIDRNKSLDFIQKYIEKTTGETQQRLIEAYLQLLNSPQPPPQK